MYDSNRSEDARSEREINEFLNRFFYKKTFRRFESIVDTKRQIAGVDVIADGLMIDNKAMSNPKYINDPRDTYTLELLVHSVKHKSEYVGWFLNSELKTTHYLFVWIHEANVPKGEWLTSCKQIRKLEVMLVDKVKLHEYINSCYSDDQLWDMSVELIKKNAERTNLTKLKSDSPIKYPPCIRYSTDYAERPCNIVMPKSILKKFSSKHCYVTAKEITDID